VKRWPTILAGLFAGLAFIYVGVFLNEGRVVRDFCHSRDKGMTVADLAPDAWALGLRTWELPETYWKGRKQYPQLIAQGDHFTCGIVVKDGRVVGRTSGLTVAFRRRFPRRLAQAGR
jgi:hypothetical protein